MDPNQKDEPPEEIADKYETGGLGAASLQTQEQSFALGDAQTVMRRFNRTTTWIATGLLSTLVVAAGVLVFQDDHPTAVNNHEEARRTSDGLVSEGSPDSPSEVVGLNGKNPDQTTSGRLVSSDPGVAHEANNGELPTKISEWSGAQRQDLSASDSTQDPQPKTSIFRTVQGGRRENAIDHALASKLGTRSRLDTVLVPAPRANQES